MTEISKRGERSPVPAEWTYAPAPESRDIVRLRERSDPAGALARIRRSGIPERRQADQGVARRRPAARRRALLLLRRLGRQARVRLPQSHAASGRRRGPDHPVELPAADARVEARA